MTAAESITDITMEWLEDSLHGFMYVIGGAIKEHVIFSDGWRTLELYPDQFLIVFSSLGQPKAKAAVVRNVKTHGDLAEVCRLFQFKIDGLEGGQ
jgi:hypothetical protein